MGGARKNETKLSQRSGEPTTYGPSYSPSDAAHFERLADFPPASAAAGARPAAPHSDTFEYTQSDAREFDRLMGLLGVVGGKVPSASRGRAAEPGYTEADNRLFDELMSSDRLGRTAGQAVLGGAQAEAPAQSAFQYSQQDLEAFAKIMPDASATDGGGPPERSKRASRPDRDVGHIKIVDFDKEHALRKENKRRGKANIKVRFFD